jgi:Phospholipase_D-nuclease N-terminal
VVIASSYPFLDIFWSMCIFFLWVIWVAFLIFLLIDNFRRPDHSGLAKAGWTVLLLFVPVLGALIYIIARPALPGELAAP